MTCRIRFLFPVILLATTAIAAADDRPDVKLPANISSGPAAGAELPIFTADRITPKACVHCVMTWGKGVVSFVKELDKPTAEFIRLLDSNQPRIAKKFPRRIRIVVIWLDGDKQLFTNWATENTIENIELGVVARNDAKLVEWKLNPDCPQTVVLLERKVTLASYGDMDQSSFMRLEASMDTHFAP